MGEVVIFVVKVINYVGVGMVEFLFDEDDLFYFMEMNICL